MELIDVISKKMNALRHIRPSNGDINYRDAIKLVIF